MSRRTIAARRPLTRHDRGVVALAQALDLAFGQTGTFLGGSTRQVAA
jgi:hypothetical protein